MEKFEIKLNEYIFTIHYDTNLNSINIEIDQKKFIDFFVKIKNEFNKKITIDDIVKINILKEIYESGKEDETNYVKLPISPIIKKKYPILHFIGDIDIKNRYKKMGLIESKISKKNIVFKFTDLCKNII